MNLSRAWFCDTLPPNLKTLTSMKVKKKNRTKKILLSTTGRSAKKRRRNKVMVLGPKIGQIHCCLHRWCESKVSETKRPPSSNPNTSNLLRKSTLSCTQPYLLEPRSMGLFSQISSVEYYGVTRQVTNCCREVSTTFRRPNWLTFCWLLSWSSSYMRWALSGIITRRPPFNGSSTAKTLKEGSFKCPCLSSQSLKISSTDF